MLSQSVKKKLKEKKVADEDVSALEALPGNVRGAIDWMALVEWVAKDGPDIIKELIAIFGGDSTAQMQSHKGPHSEVKIQGQKDATAATPGSDVAGGGAGETDQAQVNVVKKRQEEQAKQQGKEQKP